jgi:hypothetical protein
MTAARESPTGRRLGLLLLGYLGAVVAVVVFAPFDFGPFSTGRVLLLPGPGELVSDVVLNLALFVPLGFLADRIGGGRVGAGRILILGMAASVLIEGTQLFLLDRYSTVTDVAANASGAWLGAVASRGLRRRLGAADSLTGRVFLDLPLLGICWLLLPMLWVEAIQGPWLALMSVAAAGGFALAGAGRSNAARARQSGGVLWPMVIGWSVLGTLPALGLRWVDMPITVITAVLAFLAGDRWWRSGREGDRRVEPRAVLAVLVSLTPWFLLKGWGDILNPHLSRHLRELILEWLVLGAGFTVLGYAISEWRGRRETPWPKSAAIPTMVAASIALRVSHGRMVYVLAAGVVGAFGALLFQWQRAHIVASRTYIPTPDSRSD